MRIAVIGAAGGIGSVLADRLACDSRYDLLLVDNLSSGNLTNFQNLDNKKELIVSDFNQMDIETFSGTDILILLCAQSSLPECQKNLVGSISSNLITTAKAIEISQHHGTRIIFASSSAVYENSIQLPFSENSIVSPNLMYSLTKLFSEQLLESAQQTNNIHSVVLRFFNVFGPRQNYSRANPPLINYVVRQAVRGEQIKLFAPPEQIRDYVYVNDLVTLILKVIQSDISGFSIFNACSGLGVSMTSILETIQTEFQTQLDILWGEPDQLWNSNSELFVRKAPLSRERVARETLKKSIGNPQKVFEKYAWRAETKLEDAIIKEMPFMRDIYRLN
ncbi:WcaG Nucleoside-diphosphate-sugar epimerases [Candidatus Nanopelagicaceae bacterium]